MDSARLELVRALASLMSDYRDSMCSLVAIPDQMHRARRVMHRAAAALSWSGDPAELARHARLIADAAYGIASYRCFLNDDDVMRLTEGLAL